MKASITSKLVSSSSRQTSWWISGFNLGNVELDALRYAPMNVAFCHIKADSMPASKGKTWISEADVLTAEFMPRSKERQLPPRLAVNFFDGDLDEFFRHCRQRRRTPCFFSSSSASFTSWTEMHSASAISCVFILVRPKVRMA